MSTSLGYKINVYQDTMTKDVEQSLRNLIDFIERVKDDQSI